MKMIRIAQLSLVLYLITSQFKLKAERSSLDNVGIAAVAVGAGLLIGGGLVAACSSFMDESEPDLIHNAELVHHQACAQWTPKISIVESYHFDNEHDFLNLCSQMHMDTLPQASYSRRLLEEQQQKLAKRISKLHAKKQTLEIHVNLEKIKTLERQIIELNRELRKIEQLQSEYHSYTNLKYLVDAFTSKYYGFIENSNYLAELIMNYNITKSWQYPFYSYAQILSNDIRELENELKYKDKLSNFSIVSKARNLLNGLYTLEHKIKTSREYIHDIQAKEHAELLEKEHRLLQEKLELERRKVRALEKQAEAERDKAAAMMMHNVTCHYDCPEIHVHTTYCY